MVLSANKEAFGKVIAGRDRCTNATELSTKEQSVVKSLQKSWSKRVKSSKEVATKTPQKKQEKIML